MARIEITFEDDPLEINISIEHPFREVALSVAAQMSGRIAEVARARSEEESVREDD